MATVQTIFRKGFSAYHSNNNIPKHYIKAAHAFINCRTAALGGHIQECSNGHIEGVWYNSCKHRMCPQCNAIQQERWLEKQKARLLDCPHRHIIFTIPHEFHALWRFNTGVMTDLLFKTVRDTVMTLCADPQHLGAEPGLLCALHTWGRSLSLHPHIHCLVTEGGIDAKGEWKTPKRNCFLPAKVVMLVFRGKFLAYLRDALNNGALTVPPDATETRIINLINKLGRKKWNVNVRERYAHGQSVATYLARYVRGGPVHNNQLVNLTQTHVTFRYYAHTDNPDGKKRHATSLHLPLGDFIERMLNHIPVPGKHVVRTYGAYSGAKLATLNMLRQHFKQPPVDAPPFLRWETFYKRVTGKETPTSCSRCGAPLNHGMSFKREPFFFSHGPPQQHKRKQPA